MKESLNSDLVPSWVKWIAQDPDGNWWGYEAEPHQHDYGWYENEIGRCIALTSAPANPNWRTTLKKYIV